MSDDENGKSHCNINNHSKPKGVYGLLEKLHLPETTLWRNNLKFLSTTEMLKDTMHKHEQLFSKDSKTTNQTA